MNFATNKAVVFPTGKYYIGDLCYLNKTKEIWEELCDSWFENNKSIESEENGVTVEINGMKIWNHSTCYGDGCYIGFYNNTEYEFYVDSGSIGLVKVDELECKNSDHAIINMTCEFTPSYSYGTFYIGDLEILTSEEELLQIFE